MTHSDTCFEKEPCFEKFLECFVRKNHLQRYDLILKLLKGLEITKIGSSKIKFWIEWFKNNN